MLLIIVVVCGAFVMGILPRLPDLHLLVVVWILWLVGGALWFLRAAPMHTRLKQVWFWGLAFGGSALWCCYWGQSGIDDRLAAELEKRPVLLVGRVVGLPSPFVFDSARRGYRLVIAVEYGCIKVQPDCSDGRVELPDQVRVNWYGDRAPASGERWQLLVKLKRPHGYQNPGGFDYERWLLSRGIGATGYVRDSEHNRRLASANIGSIDSLRDDVRTALVLAADISGETDGLGLLLALLLGDKSHLTETQRQPMQSLGLAHLLAISGLHIGLAAGVGGFIGVLIGRSLNVCCHGLVIAPVAMLICGWLLACLYAAMAGFSLPTQRALIMLTVWGLLMLSGVSVSAWLSWWLAMAVVLLVQPLSFYDVGFWLSFGAVAVLIASFRGGYQQSGSFWLGLLQAQWVLLLGVGLLQWFAGLPVTLLAPFANIVAVPLVSFLVTPLLFLMLFGYFVDDGLFLFLAELSLTLLGQFSVAVVQIADAAAVFERWWLFEPVAISGDVARISALAGLVLWLLPLPVLFRCLSALAVGLGFLGDVDREGTRDVDGLVVRVLDVGQGLAVMIHHRDRHWLVDTGRDFHFSFVLEPYLRSQNIQQLTGLFVSHGDSDHAGSLSHVLEGYPVDFLYMGQDDVLMATQVGFHPCNVDRQWSIDGVGFETLGWQSQQSMAGVEDSNNHSCVLLISYAGVRILLPGDIEIERERDLLGHRALQADVDVVLVPHHGSRTSSSPSFIDGLKPDWALVSAGYLNQYGHPATSVVDRYRANGARVLLTAEEGAITVVIASNGKYEVRGFRSEQQRYWR